MTYRPAIKPIGSLHGPRYEVDARGAIEQLKIDSLACDCGDIVNSRGVAFSFGNRGGWVLHVDDLREIVRLADEYQAKCIERIREELTS